MCCGLLDVEGAVWEGVEGVVAVEGEGVDRVVDDLLGLEGDAVVVPDPDLEGDLAGVVGEDVDGESVEGASGDVGVGDVAGELRYKVDDERWGGLPWVFRPGLAGLVVVVAAVWSEEVDALVVVVVDGEFAVGFSFLDGGVHGDVVDAAGEVERKRRCVVDLGKNGLEFLGGGGGGLGAAGEQAGGDENGCGEDGEVWSGHLGQVRGWWLLNSFFFSPFFLGVSGELESAVRLDRGDGVVAEDVEDGLLALVVGAGEDEAGGHGGVGEDVWGDEPGSGGVVECEGDEVLCLGDGGGGGCGDVVVVVVGGECPGAVEVGEDSCGWDGFGGGGDVVEVVCAVGFPCAPDADAGVEEAGGAGGGDEFVGFGDPLEGVVV